MIEALKRSDCYLVEAEAGPLFAELGLSWDDEGPAAERMVAAGEAEFQSDTLVLSDRTGCLSPRDYVINQAEQNDCQLFAPNQEGFEAFEERFADAYGWDTARQTLGALIEAGLISRDGSLTLGEMCG